MGSRLHEKQRILHVVIFLLGLTLLLTGCRPEQQAPLTKDNLAGKRVGVMLGYSTDYILSRPEYGLKIFRYDAYADMKMALKFRRIDAIAMEMDEAYVFCRVDPSYKIALRVQEQLAYGYVLNSTKKDLLREFNQFIKPFRASPEYADIRKRVEAAAHAPYAAKHVKNVVTTDRVLRVALFPGWEPISYQNNANKQWEGCDVELITHFANSLGAKVKWVDTNDWVQMVLNLSAGKVDLFLCPDSLALKEDLEMKGTVTMSEGVFDKDLVLIVCKEDR